MPAGLLLTLSEGVTAPRDRIFQLLTAPELLSQWWGPRGVTMPEIEIDPRSGGRYRFTMQPPDGSPFHLSGEFREVSPSRLAFTFRYEEPTPDDRETLVTLSFRDRDGSTAVALEQGAFRTEARRELHRDGWGESVDRLERLLAERG